MLCYMLCYIAIFVSCCGATGFGVTGCEDTHHAAFVSLACLPCLVVAHSKVQRIVKNRTIEKFVANPCDEKTCDPQDRTICEDTQLAIFVSLACLACSQRNTAADIVLPRTVSCAFKLCPAHCGDTNIAIFVSCCGATGWAETSRAGRRVSMGPVGTAYEKKGLRK